MMCTYRKDMVKYRCLISLCFILAPGGWKPIYRGLLNGLYYQYKNNPSLVYNY